MTRAEARRESLLPFRRAQTGLRTFSDGNNSWGIHECLLARLDRIIYKLAELLIQKVRIFAVGS